MCEYFIKCESAHICQCCLSDSNLKSMADNFIFENEIKVYSEMITKCFAIKFPAEESTGYFICDLCILRLRDSYNFRNQVDRVQSTLKKKQDLDSIRDTPLRDMLKNDIKVNTIKQEHYSVNEFLCYSEEKPELKSEESQYVTKEATGNVNVLSKIKKERLRKIIKPPIFTKPNDEPSNADNSTNNVIINSKSGARSTGRKRSKEELRDFRRRYETKRYAKAIPYKLEKTDVSCKICSATFTTNANLVKHMPEHYPNLVCHICGKLTLSVKLLHAHLRSHNPERVACHICNKVMKKYSIHRHIQKHTGDNLIYSCQNCPEKFSSYNSRLYHLAKEHQVSAMRYKCKVCPKAFRYSGTLATHVRRCHLQERTLPCLECGKLFFCRREIDMHMVKHTKEKKFQCAVCLKSYGRKCTLIQHMKIHNNEKQYKCTVCERTFTQKCTLKGHMKIHEKLNAQQLCL